MHELSIITEALRFAEESARAAGANRIVAVQLRVGQLSSVVPEAMQFAWEAARQGTLAERAELQIESIAPACWCAACEYEFPAQHWSGVCPKCRAVSTTLRRGCEIEIARLEVE